MKVHILMAFDLAQGRGLQTSAHRYMANLIRILPKREYQLLLSAARRYAGLPVIPLRERRREFWEGVYHILLLREQPAPQ